MEYTKIHQIIAKETGLNEDLVYYLRSKMLGGKISRLDLYKHLRNRSHSHFKLAVEIMRSITKANQVNGDGHSSTIRHLRDLLNKQMRCMEWAQVIKFLSNKDIRKVLREV